MGCPVKTIIDRAAFRVGFFLEQKMIAEGKAAGFIGLKGHRSVGGIRVSIYNAMTLEGVEKVTDFMKSFMQDNS